MVGSDMASQNVCVVWGGFLKGKCFRVDVMQLGFLDCKDRMVGGGFRMDLWMWWMMRMKVCDFFERVTFSKWDYF